MANYGGYQTVSRLGHSPQAEVWTARAAGEEADALEQHVVKVYHPIEFDFEVGSGAGIQEFLEAAQLQGALAQAKPDTWAPIQTAGTTDDEAFYVTAYFTHSAEDLTKVQLDSRTLHRILSAAVQGLLDLREVAQRPHGNLKATNVLIATGEDVARMRVLLTDPLPGAKLDPRMAAVGDIRALGLLLHRLAVQRQPASKGPQLVPSAEGWNRLGRKGRAWRDLCTQLLMTPENVTLEQVSAQLARLYEAPSAGWRLPVLIGGVAALLLVAAGLYFFVLRHDHGDGHRPVEVFDKAAWSDICDSHYKWFAKFLDDMSAARRARWRGEPPLDAVVKDLDEAQAAGIAFDPRDIAGKPGAAIEDLKAWEPEPQKVKEVNPKVRQAARVIGTVRATLSPAGWRELAALKRLADTWASRGWARPSRFVASYVDAVRTDANLAASVDRLVAFARNQTVGAIEPIWAAIEEAQKKLESSAAERRTPDDKVVAKFLKWAQDEGRSEGAEGVEADVEGLLKKLQAARAIGSDLARAADDMAAKKVDSERFLAEASVHTAFDGTVMEHTFRRWLRDAGDYYYLSPDPRGTPEDWSKRTAKVAGDIAELEKLGDEGKGQAAKFRQALASAVKAKLDAMWKLVPIRRDEHLVKRGADEAREELEQLHARVQGAIILFAGSSKEWLEGTLRFEFASAPAIQAAWERARKALLGNVKPADLEADRDKYLALRNQVHRLRDGLDRLDGELPKDLPEAAEKHSARQWYNAFLRRARQKRDEALRALLEAIAGGKDVPDLASDEAARARADAVKTFLQWREELAALVVSFSTVEEALDNCYLLAEKPPGMAEPLGTTYRQLSQARFLSSEDDLRRALDPVAQRVARVGEIQGIRDRAALADRGMRAGSREAVLAAWRALGSLGDPAWPNSAEELRAEGVLRQRLAAELRSISLAPRREALQKEVTQGGQEREIRWLTTHLAALRQTVDGAGDAVLAAFGKYADGQLGGVSKDDLAPYLERLNELKPLAEALAGVAERDWPKRVARDLFTKESAVHRDFESNKAPADKALFARWLQEVKDYYYLDEADPLLRRRKAVGDEERAVRQALGDLARQNKAEADRLLARLEQDVAPCAHVPPIVKAKADLTARVTAAEKALPELTKGIGAVIELIRLDNEIAAKVKAIEASQDPVLARFGTFVEQERKGVAEGDVAARKAKLTAIRNTADQFESLVRGDWAANRIERALFAKESKVHRHFQGAPAVTQAVLDAWLAEVKEYYVLEPDPRGKRADWDAKAKEVEALLARLKKFGGDYVKKAEKRGAELKELVAKSIEPLWTVEPVRKNEERLLALVNSARRQSERLRGEVEGDFEPEPQWRARILKSEQVAKPDALNKVWRMRRDALLKTYGPEVLRASGDLYLTIRAKFDELAAFYAALDDAAALPPPPPGWAKPLLAEGAKARESTLETAANATIPLASDGFPSISVEAFKKSDAWREVCSGYTKALAAIARVETDLAQLQALLDAGYLPDDKPDGAPRTLRAVFADWEKQPPPAALVRAFEPAIQRGRALLQLAAAPRQQLVTKAAEAKEGDPPQELMLVWQGLGKAPDWPASLDELKLEAKLRDQLAALVAKLAAKNAHPVRWAADELAKEGPRRWEAAFNALIARLGKQGGTDADVREAIALAPRLGAAREALAPVTQLRWLLWEFRQEIGALPETAKKDELVAALDAFERKVRALPGDVAKLPAMETLLKEARAALARAEETGSSGLDKGGPAAAAVGVKWAAAPAGDGSSAAYSWEVKGHSLTFVRVQPRQGVGRPAYLCTTEVSLGLFIDAVAAAEKWQDVKELLGLDRLSGVDPRRGPRGWQPTRDRSAIQPTREWLVALPGVALHPADAVPPPPSRSHPIQYVGPGAAIYVARLLGCRLPTSAEWAGALDAYGGAKEAGAPNLRDKTWQRQQQHVAGQGGRLDWPDAGAFVAARATTVPKVGPEAGIVSNEADGVLWFATPGTGAGMQHLVGNVAEYVFDSPSRLDELLKEPGGPSVRVVRDIVDKGATFLKVAGASALSPPEYWDGSGPRPFDRSYSVDLEKAQQGYSDVGFRLAFTAPVDPPAVRLASVLREQGYP